MAGKPATPIEAYSEPLGENPPIGSLFKPEPPFDIYTRGFVYYSKRDDRRAVTVYTPSVENNYNPAIKRNLFAGTYLHAVKLFKEIGQLIPTGYEVDHKDDNRWNDTYGNLQVIAAEENARKEGLRVGCLWYTMICPVCRKQWDATFNNTQLLPELKDHVFYCSPECRVVFRSTLFPYDDFMPLRQWIARRQIYQTVRVWKEQGRREVIETLCDEMLTFDLATACGRPVFHDTPRLLPGDEQKSLAKDLRRQGRSWSEIGVVFGISGGQARVNFKDETMENGVGGRNQSRNEAVIRLFNDEGKSKTEIAKMFNIELYSVTRILRTKQ